MSSRLFMSDWWLTFFLSFPQLYKKLSPFKNWIQSMKPVGIYFLSTRKIISNAGKRKIGGYFDFYSNNSSEQDFFDVFVDGMTKSHLAHNNFNKKNSEGNNTRSNKLLGNRTRTKERLKESIGHYFNATFSHPNCKWPINGAMCHKGRKKSFLGKLQIRAEQISRNKEQQIRRNWGNRFNQIDKNSNGKILENDETFFATMIAKIDGNKKVVPKNK